MGFLDSASFDSQWRGYEYFREKKVLSVSQVSKTEYAGSVSGSGEAPYSVRIDIAHPKRSTCDCPFAEGTRRICKHKIALFFTLFPEAADKYLQEVGQAEQEAEEYSERMFEKAHATVMQMKKAELQEVLWRVLTESPEWVPERFVRDYAK